MIADLGTAPEYVYDQMRSQPHEVYETRNVVVMSTVHMTLRDAAKIWEDIDAFPLPTRDMGAGEGYMIWLCPDDYELFEEYLIRLAEEGYSGILACALVRAHNRGFDYLWLDPDAPVVISLPKSDW